MSFSATAKTLLVGAVIAISLAGAAEARERLFTATLAQPVSEATRVIAGNALWTCEGDTCRAQADHGVTVHACRRLVREAGAVTAYGPENDLLDAAELERCNAYATAAAPQTAAN